MTPKEKAKELVEKMSYNDFDEDHNCSHYVAKNCALIAVDEILDLNLGLSNCDENNWDIDKFYLKVKQEIEKL
jgi:putative IMPACT (imprinted ancient) family translation regulator